MKPIVIAGANGFLGTHLVQHLKRKGYSVEGIVRQPMDTELDIPLHRWNGRTLGEWATRLNGAYALINLCGKSVNCRYTPANKEAILKSRAESTGILNEAIALCPKPPEVWLNASTATIYRDARDRPMMEADGEIGNGFSIDVAKAWETAFFAKELANTRRVALRTSLVLGQGSNSALPVLEKLTRRGLGGKIGDGQQVFSWIHIDDFCRALAHILEEDTLQGPVNVTAPAPLTNEAFMEQLRKAVGIPFGIPTPKPLLELGAILLRTETELPLKSRWVVPEKLMRSRFLWTYPFVDEALEHLVCRKGTANKRQFTPMLRDLEHT